MVCMFSTNIILIKDFGYFIELKDGKWELSTAD